MAPRRNLPTPARRPDHAEGPTAPQEDLPGHPPVRHDDRASSCLSACSPIKTEGPLTPNITPSRADGYPGPGHRHGARHHRRSHRPSPSGRRLVGTSSLGIRDRASPGGSASRLAWLVIIPSAPGRVSALTRHPGLHRHLAGMLISGSTSGSASPHRARARRLPGHRRRLLPEVGPTPATTTSIHPARHPGCAAIVFGAIRQPGATGQDQRRGSRGLGHGPGWPLTAWSRHDAASSPGSKGLPVSGLISRRACPHLRHSSRAKTVPGRYIHAVGGNRHAAELSEEQEDQLRHVTWAVFTCRAGCSSCVHRLRPDGVGWTDRSPPSHRWCAVTGGRVSVIGSIVVVRSWPSPPTACRSGVGRRDVGHQGPGPARRRPLRRSTIEPGAVDHRPVDAPSQGLDSPAAPAATTQPGCGWTSSLSETTRTEGCPRRTPEPTLARHRKERRKGMRH